MQIHQLKQFCAVARTEHMTRAASDLFISQSTLSLNITRLEKELGVKLFDRSGRNIKLNRYGREFLYHVERALDELETARQSVINSASEQNNQIVIADALLNNTNLIIKEYLAENPSIKVTHQKCTLPEIRVMLESGSIDFAIALLAPEYDFGKYIQWSPVYRTRLMAIMPEHHELAKKDTLELTDLAEQPLMYAIKNFDGRDAFDAYCRRAGFEPGYTYNSISSFLFNSLSRENGAISIVCECMWEHRLEAKPLQHGVSPDIEGLTARIITPPDCIVDFGILVCKGHYLSGPAMNFKAFVSSYIQKFPGIF